MTPLSPPRSGQSRQHRGRDRGQRKHGFSAVCRRWDPDPRRVLDQRRSDSDYWRPPHVPPPENHCADPPGPGPPHGALHVCGDQHGWASEPPLQPESAGWVERADAACCLSAGVKWQKTELTIMSLSHVVMVTLFRPSADQGLRCSNRSLCGGEQCAGASVWGLRYPHALLDLAEGRPPAPTDRQSAPPAGGRSSPCGLSSGQSPPGLYHDTGNCTQHVTPPLSWALQIVTMKSY